MNHQNQLIQNNQIIQNNQLIQTGGKTPYSTEKELRLGSELSTQDPSQHATQLSSQFPTERTSQSPTELPTQLVLTEEDQQKMTEIKEATNLFDSQTVATYGVAAQRQLSDFSSHVLSQVKTKDTGPVGTALVDLSVAVQSMEVDSLDQDDFWSFLPWKNTMKKFLGRYQTVESQLAKIETQLDQATNMLLKDIGIFDALYQRNLDYFQQLNLYIEAGEEILIEARDNTLPQLRKNAEQSQDPMKIQQVRDLEESIDRFEQKVHNLKLSRTICLQTAPQIRLIQNNDKLLMDKVQTAVMHTLPLWKNQIVIAISLHNQKQVLEVNKKITDATNDLLRQNASLLKDNSINIARETQRGIVDIDTLKQVNQDLLTTIQETMEIQQKGRAARQQAEEELKTIEGEIGNAILQHMGA